MCCVRGRDCELGEQAHSEGGIQFHTEYTVSASFVFFAHRETFTVYFIMLSSTGLPVSTFLIQLLLFDYYTIVLGIEVMAWVP